MNGKVDSQQLIAGTTRDVYKRMKQAYKLRKQAGVIYG